MDPQRILKKFLTTKTATMAGGALGFIEGASLGAGIPGVVDTFTRMASGQIHAPTAQDITNKITAYSPSLSLAIIGYLAKMFGGKIHPIIGRVGSFVSALGAGLYAGQVGGGILHAMTHSGGTGPPQTGRNDYHYPSWPVNPYNPGVHHTQPIVSPTPRLRQINPPVTRR